MSVVDTPGGTERTTAPSAEHSSRAQSARWAYELSMAGLDGLGYMLVFSSMVVVTGGVTAWMIEEPIDTVGDGLWWSLVTATTVGYGDISPESVTGRLTAAVLMLVGIGTLGMITGSIATYFLEEHEERGDQRTNPQVAWVRDQLDGWETLDVAERQRLAAMLSALAEHEATQ